MIGSDNLTQQPVTPFGKRKRMLKQVERRTVSKKFRLIAEKCLPRLNADPAYWQLFGYLLFGSSFDEDSGKLLIGQPKLAKVLGEDGNNFVARNFLERFQRDVMPAGSFQWSPYSKVKEKCRQVDRCEWPDELNEAIPHEIAKDWHGGGRLYLDGSAFSEGKRASARQADKAESFLREGIGPDAKRIQRYMNDLKQNLFTDIVDKNYELALAAAKAIPNERSRRAQLRMLRKISDQQQPFYSPSFDGNTVRLFASEHIPNLQGEVRRALTREWPEADLKSSQLAICAWIWKVPLVLDFLKTGRNIWNHLAQAMNIPAVRFYEAKPIFKRAVYSVCYGQLTRVVQADVTKGLISLGIEKAGKRFIENDIISVLLEARDREMDKIRRAGGAVDCYGHIIFLNNGRKPRQILAQVAQAWEMKLITPIFELAEFTSDFRIMLYQFDGLSIHFGKREREDVWKRKIEEAVKKEADTLGIPTGLEWKG